MSARGVPERRLYHKYPLELGEKGRKTGWQPKRSIRRDSDGLDNVLDFFGSSSGEEVAEEMDERAYQRSLSVAAIERSGGSARRRSSRRPISPLRRGGEMMIEDSRRRRQSVPVRRVVDDSDVSHDEEIQEDVEDADGYYARRRPISPLPERLGYDGREDPLEPPRRKSVSRRSMSFQPPQDYEDLPSSALSRRYLRPEDQDLSRRRASVGVSRRESRYSPPSASRRRSISKPPAPVDLYNSPRHISEHQSPAYASRLDEFRANRRRQRLEEPADIENDEQMYGNSRRRSSLKRSRSSLSRQQAIADEEAEIVREERVRRRSHASPYQNRMTEEAFDEPQLYHNDQELEEHHIPETQYEEAEIQGDYHFQEDEEGESVQNDGLETVMENEAMARAVSSKKKSRTTTGSGKKRTAKKATLSTAVASQSKRSVSRGPPPAARSAGQASRAKILSRRSASVVPDRDYGGVRKSNRAVIRPISWWNGDKVLYKRELLEGSLTGVPVIDSVMKMEEDEIIPRKRQKRSTNGTVSRKEKTVENVLDKTRRAVDIKAKNADGEEEVQQLVISQSMITFQETATQFSYAKTQQIPDIESASTGFMVLEPGGEKPNRNTKANTLSFVVITGKVEVTIYKTSVVVGVGTQFSVPAGNQYRLINRGKSECRVFWVCLTPPAGAAKAPLSGRAIAKAPTSKKDGDEKKTKNKFVVQETDSEESEDGGESEDEEEEGRHDKAEKENEGEAEKDKMAVNKEKADAVEEEEDDDVAAASDIEQIEAAPEGAKDE